MTADRFDVSPLEDPQRRLEQAFIDEFLRLRGCEPGRLDAIPVPERELLMKQASAWASGKLAEVDARACFVHEVHGGVEETHKPPHR
jgi:hypothetical protein